MSNLKSFYKRLYIVNGTCTMNIYMTYSATTNSTYDV